MDVSGPSLMMPDGRRVGLWHGGAPDGFPVFFLHGCPDCRLQAASGSAAARRAEVRLIAVDRPGYGRSDPHRSDHLTVAEDLAAIADLLGCDRFAILGMSVGGPYALACAATYGSRVTAVGVVGSPADPADLPAASGTLLAQVAAASYEDAMEMFRPDFLQWRNELRPDHSGDVELVERLVAGVHPLDAAVIRRLSAADVAAELRESVRSEQGYLRDAAVTFRPWRFDLDAIWIPSHLWYGEHDPNALGAERLAGRLPKAMVSIRTNTAHLGALINHWTEIFATLRGSATQ